MQGSKKIHDEESKLIAEYKANGKQKEISKAIKELRERFKAETPKIPKELCYLTGSDREDYLHDMKICQEFAVENRRIMAATICRKMDWENVTYFETIHNYIEHNTNMVRKGAISARSGERLLIPMNMRDGCIIGVGKGNEDWNCSAPHGAGRIMSRRKAQENISLEEFEKSMSGIYTTSVNQSTIDESPMAYKPIDEIVENIKDTVEIQKIIKPIYNFKASE
jgi:RNA-splicing ligase RtcB